MKRLSLFALSLLPFVCVPANAAYSWNVSESLNTSSWANGFSIVGTNGQYSLTRYQGGVSSQYNCGYMLTSGYPASNVVRTVFSSSAMNIQEVVGASTPQSGDSGPTGTYFKTVINNGSLTLYLNDPIQGLIAVGYAYTATVGNNIMTVLNGQTVGVFVNSSLVLSSSNPSYAYPSITGGLGHCDVGDGAYIGNIDVGDIGG
jgi:hypothetical protein